MVMFIAYISHPGSLLLGRPVPASGYFTIVAQAIIFSMENNAAFPSSTCAVLMAWVFQMLIQFSENELSQSRSRKRR